VCALFDHGAKVEYQRRRRKGLKKWYRSEPDDDLLWNIDEAAFLSFFSAFGLCRMGGGGYQQRSVQRCHQQTDSSPRFRRIHQPVSHEPTMQFYTFDNVSTFDAFFPNIHTEMNFFWPFLINI
jgi:hypothetical protein